MSRKKQNANFKFYHAKFLLLPNLSIALITGRNMVKVARQKCTVEAKTSNNNRPITSDKCLSKTELPKHVNDSLHRRLISDSNRRLYKTMQLTLTLTAVHSALLATMCFIRWEIATVTQRKHFQSLLEHPDDKRYQQSTTISITQKSLSYWTKSVTVDVKQLQQFSVISWFQREFCTDKTFAA